MTLPVFVGTLVKLVMAILNHLQELIVILEIQGLFSLISKLKEIGQVILERVTELGK